MEQNAFALVGYSDASTVESVYNELKEIILRKG
jgi:hypothetical protein